MNFQSQKYTIFEITKLKEREEKKDEKSEQNFSNMWDNVKQSV